MSLTSAFSRAVTRVAHAIFDPTRTRGRSPSPAPVEPAGNPAPVSNPCVAHPDQADKLRAMAKEVGPLPAVTVAHPEHAHPAHVTVLTPELLRKVYPLYRELYPTPRSMLN